MKLRVPASPRLRVESPRYRFTRIGGSASRRNCRKLRAQSIAACLLAVVVVLVAAWIVVTAAGEC